MCVWVEGEGVLITLFSAVHHSYTEPLQMWGQPCLNVSAPTALPLSFS